jgi:peptide/nickel transport system substrate-binding protein
VAQLAALKAGEIDYVPSIPPEQFDDYFGVDDKPNKDIRERFAKVEIVYPTFGYVGFNMRKDIWKDKKVRWAISHAHCDVDKFLKDVLKGRAERVASPNYKYAPFYNNDIKPVPYDPKKAEELLADAGWFDSDGDGILDKDGKKFEFELLTREMPPTMPAMQHCLLMQQNLKKLGIKMEIRKLEWTAFLDKVDRGDFDVCRLGWALSSPPNTQDNYQIWHSSQIGESGSNHIAYANKEVDQLLTDIRKELDPEKRKKMQIRFQEIIHEDQPYIFLWMPADFRAYNKKWQGVRFSVPRPCHSLPEWYLGE